MMLNNNSPLFVLAGGSALVFVFTYISVGSLRNWAVRKKYLDVPNERSSHQIPTPQGGGIAIVAITLIGGLLSTFCLRDGSFHWMVGYAIGAALIAAVSWMDDLKWQPIALRFVVHCLGALTAILSIGYIASFRLPIVGEVHMGWLGAPITFLWIVSLTNIYNFMDGIDGIAGGQAVVAGMGWAVFGLLGHQTSVVCLALLLVSSNLAFLFYNWSPARIFMGDVGSAFLGYTFAVLMILPAQQNSRSVLMGMLFLWPFLFDSTFTLVNRSVKGENVFKSHRSHLYQKLAPVQRRHRPVTLLYGGLSLIGTVLALAWFFDVMKGSLAVAILPVLCYGLWKMATNAGPPKTSDATKSSDEPQGETLLSGTQGVNDVSESVEPIELPAVRCSNTIST